MQKIVDDTNINKKICLIEELIDDINLTNETENLNNVSTIDNHMNQHVTTQCNEKDEDESTILQIVLDPVSKIQKRMDYFSKLQTIASKRTACTQILQDETCGWQLIECALNVAKAFVTEIWLIPRCMWHCRNHEYPLIRQNAASLLQYCTFENDAIIEALEQFDRVEVFECLDSELEIPLQLVNIIKSNMITLLRLFKYSNTDTAEKSLEAIGSLLDVKMFKVAWENTFVENENIPYWILNLLLRGTLRNHEEGADIVIGLVLDGMTLRHVLPKVLKQWIYIKNEDENAQKSVKAMQDLAAVTFKCCHAFLDANVDLQPSTLLDFYVAACGWLCTKEQFPLPWLGMPSLISAAKSLITRLESTYEPLRSYDPSELWGRLRFFLGNNQWKHSEWQLTSSMCFLILSTNDRRVLCGETNPGLLLPLVLPLVDDSENQICRAGLGMLSHLVDLLSPTETRWFESMFSARVEQIVFGVRDLEVAKLAVPLFLVTLRKKEALEYPFTLRCAAIHKILGIVSYSSNATMYILFVNALRELVHDVKLCAVQFTKRLFECCETGLTFGGVSNHQARSAALDLLLDVLRQCPTRISSHTSKIIALIARHRLILDTIPLDEAHDLEIAKSKQAMALLLQYGDAVVTKQACERLERFVQLMSDCDDE